MYLKNKSESGQVIVEYVLLLLVVVAIAAGIVKTVASRDPSDPGFLIEAWDNMLNSIGNDLSD